MALRLENDQHGPRRIAPSSCIVMNVVPTLTRVLGCFVALVLVACAKPVEPVAEATKATTVDTRPAERRGGPRSTGDFAILYAGPWQQHTKVDVLPDGDGVRLDVHRNIGHIPCRWWRHFDGGESATRVKAAIERLESLTQQPSCYATMRDGAAWIILGPDGERWSTADAAKECKGTVEPFRELMRLAGLESCSGVCLRADETVEAPRFCRGLSGGAPPRPIHRTELTPRQQTTDARQLELRLTLEPIAGSAPAYVRLALRNVGEHSLWVNARMATGPNKEVWLEATNALTGEKRAQDRCFAKQEPPSPQDNLLLMPGAEYSIVRPLSCFQFSSSGPWTIVAHYHDIREELMPPPHGVRWFGGALTSNEVQIAVRERRGDGPVEESRTPP